MTPDPVMNKALQIETLKRIFNSLNPGIGADLVDWEGDVDATLSLPKNQIELNIIYPQYKWLKDEEEAKAVKREALRETKELLDYMTSALPEEMQPDYKAIFDDYLSKIKYYQERGISTASLYKTIAEQRKAIEKLQTEARRAGRPEPTRKEIEEHVKIPPEPRPLAWTTRLENKLRDIFQATFTREGLSPAKFMSEYRIELETIQTLPTEDEMVAAVEALAAELVQRELGRKIKPPRIGREEKPPREVRIGPPIGEEEGEFYTPITQVPSGPLSEWPFPRLLSFEEKEIIWSAFMDALTTCGKNAYNYRTEFDDHLGIWMFKSWDQVTKHFDNLINSLCKEKEITIPIMETYIPWKSTEEAIIHLSSIEQYKNMDELLEALNEYGFTTSDEEVKKTIKEAWSKKNIRLIMSNKDYLEKLLGEPLH